MANDCSNKSTISKPFEVDELYRLQVREERGYAMFVMDPGGCITSWNAGVEQLFGYTEDEWIGQHASVIFCPEDQAEEVCEAEMRLAEKSGTATDIRWHRRKDGSQLFANGVMSAVRDDSGELIGFSKIISDDTMRKHLQDSLTESNTALEQFAYVASHDLQEPLRTMRTYAQLLERRHLAGLDPEAAQLLRFITSASERMSVLVNDLLLYARLTTEEDRPTSASLDEDIEAALSHLDHAIQECGATVTHDPLPTLPVDRGQMVRLFQNLIGNAVKYRKTNEQCRVHVSAEHQGSEWTIAVRDNGIGFDPQYAALIFEPFKRLHTEEEYPGSGVGLAICRRIVQAHGGRIWAESKPQEETTFFFTLPEDDRDPRGH